ncbi:MULTISPECIES: hypothetical protein [unclassified Pseudomonas]|uniref:hypothetical protein n=1 Tax=unclassified Pseudomonas TaxID=196821 RepID=UPI000D3C1024|nr:MULTISPECIES: hypothetical protein [unclassified Pseudomonas]RAU46622.1 hypothetical protein DBP26_010705 [Pseudomonas sp. RIT 409]RAU52364.1 hypothetical protein DBY65_017145 [Pseudomonas sp. RIT 412]
MDWIDNLLRVLGFAWLGGLLAIVGLAFAVLTYLWTRRRTKFTYVHLGEHLLGSTSDKLPPAIAVQYNGISIPRLTKTVIIIWNDGENTISRSDIVNKDPLRLQVGKDGHILSASILKTSRDVIDFKLDDAESPNEALLTFDFLDAKDGAVIEVLHTSTERKPRLLGTLKGLPQGFQSLGQFKRPNQRMAKNRAVSKILAFILSPIALAAAGFSLGLFGPHPDFLAVTPRVDSSASALLGVVSGFVATWAASSWASRRRYPKSLYLDALE